MFLDDAGASPKLRAVGEIPSYDGSEYPATLGQSADDAGNVYVQWHRRDNAGRVEILRLPNQANGADQGNGANQANGADAIKTDFVKGTQTAIQLPGLLSVASVSIRGKDVYRVRPEQSLGLCRHTAGQEQPEILCAAPSICPPVLTR